MQVFARDTSVSPQQRTEMDVDVNTEDFIAEIEQFPAIWDTSSNDYSNKVIKKNSWEQVMLKFCPEFGDKPDAEKTAIGLRFQRKWKSLRDSYMRELAKWKKEKSGSGASGRKQYIYFKQLSFLQTSQKETTSSILEEPAESQADDTQEDSTPDGKEGSEVPERPMTPRKRKSISSSSKEAEYSLFVAVANKIMKDKSETYVERDEDTLFMLSLVTELKKIPDDRKLDVKAEILGVFQKFKRNEYFPLSPPQHFQHHQQHFMRPQLSTSTMPYTGTAHHYPTHTATPLQSPSGFNSLSSASSPAPASPQSQCSFIDF